MFLKIVTIECLIINEYYSNYVVRQWAVTFLDAVDVNWVQKILTF